MKLITSGPFLGMPAEFYRCVLADCPWATKAWSAKGEGRAAISKYNTMVVEELCALPVADLCHRDAWLFFWICGPQLFQAERVMNAWGFEYSGYAFEWVKSTRWGSLFKGLGKTTRGNMELCLLGRRGRAKVEDHGVDELIIAPVREHSRKPYEAHLRIERFCIGPRLELFARQGRPGWHGCGDQAPDIAGYWRRRLEVPRNDAQLLGVRRDKALNGGVLPEAQTE